MLNRSMMEFRTVRGGYRERKWQEISSGSLQKFWKAHCILNCWFLFQMLTTARFLLLFNCSEFKFQQPHVSRGYLTGQHRDRPSSVLISISSLFPKMFCVPHRLWIFHPKTCLGLCPSPKCPPLPRPPHFPSIHTHPDSTSCCGSGKVEEGLWDERQSSSCLWKINLPCGHQQILPRIGIDYTYLQVWTSFFFILCPQGAVHIVGVLYFLNGLSPTILCKTERKSSSGSYLRVLESSLLN